MIDITDQPFLKKIKNIPITFASAMQSASEASAVDDDDDDDAGLVEEG